MAKKLVKRKNRAKLTEVIEEAAERAAEDALDEANFGNDGFETPADELDREFIDRAVARSSPADTEVDVFDFAWKECRDKNDTPRFWIHRNSEFLCIKEWPYDFERLQKEYGGGLYKISARSRKTGQVIKVQSEMIASQADEADYQEDQAQAVPQPSPFEFMTHMDRVRQESRREAEAASQQQTNTLAAMMTALTQSQQSQMQQMQMMMIENSKLAQAQIQAAQAQAQKSSESTLTLLITLLSKKDDGPKGLSPIELVKLLEDREKHVLERRRAEDERFEKRMNQIRDELESKDEGDGEEKESLTQSLIKGFIPIIANMQQQQAALQGQQLTPEQHAQLLHEENQRQLEHQKQQDEINNRRQREISSRKAQAAGPTAVAGGAPMPTRTVGGAPAPARNVNPQVVPAAPVQGPPANAPEEVKVMTNVREKLQAQIFEYVKDDLGIALMQSADASKTAEQLLEKLAKVNVTRQNVLEVFTLQDFFKIAEVNGVPLNLAGTWLEEFYNAIRTRPPNVPTEPAGKPPAHINGAGIPAAPLPRVGNGSTPRRRPGQPPKNIGN
jgi:hypothetical protein